MIWSSGENFGTALFFPFTVAWHAVLRTFACFAGMIYPPKYECKLYCDGLGR